MSHWYPTTGVRASSARSGRPGRRLAVAVLAALTLLVPMLSAFSSPAVADTAPQAPVTTPTVSADALPTVQINGVVWDQVIVGNTVYVTGEFTSARPAGSAAGTNETPRSNILAYNLTTGALITTWAPTLNAQGKAIKASADGSVIYVGGSFTSVSGVARNRLVALNASTGAVITTFNPNSASRVNTLAISGTTLYAGGIFTAMGGQARSRLAAVSTVNGAVQPWAPVADGEVSAMTAPAGSNEVVVGGHFTSLSGTNAQGLGAISTVDGSTLPFAINTIIQDGGPDAGITSLSSDGTRVYGTGYTYGPGNFEGTFAANANGGGEVFITGCRGDTYDAVPIGAVLYSVSHSHDCSSIGGNPQTNPWTFQHAWATSIGQGANGYTNQGGTFNGQPAPDLLHWLPTFTNGSYTGATQAAWTIEGNSQYVVAGGEFPSVNSTPQQGLVRFAVSSVAPNKQGPNSTVNPNAMVPTLVSLSPGQVRVSWPAAWDRDNRRLTYEVLRGATLGSSVVIGTQTGDSTWFNRPTLFFQDTTAPVGTTQTYRIRAKDAFGNTLIGNTAAIQVPAGNGTSSTYANGVLADGANHLWRLGEPSGTNAYDYASADDLTLINTATRGADGAMVNDATATSTTFTGSAGVPAVTPSPSTAPNTFTTEGWFKTTTTSGGKIIGYGDGKTGNSNNYDRQVYMTNGGQIVFGVYSGGTQTIGGPAAYNDGQWHQFTASLSSAGMELFMDGKRVARNTGVTVGQPFSGYWRVGGDNLGGWPSQPSSGNFAGSIEDVATYPTALSLSQVQTHFQNSGRSLNLPTRPTDAYGASVWDDSPSIYWRLDDAAGSTTALNRMTNEPSATYSSGVVQAQAGAPANSAGSSVSFPGTSNQAVISTTPVNNPTTYSIETWFRTTTTSGGRLIGFGNSTDVNGSSGYDRYIYMLNDGTLRYGIYNGNTTTVASPAAYNDGQWHQTVATQGPNGMQLFVDGVLVGSNTATDPQNYTGYWRLGTDNTWGGASSNSLNGSLDEAAVYDTVLTAGRVNAHWLLGKPATANQAPTAAFTSTKAGLKASFDGSGSADADGTIASYAWSYGDGATGTGVSPDHTYAAAGTYTVGLTVTDDKGATGTVTDTVTVSQPANVLPTAAFSSSTSKLRATFDGSGSSDPDGTIASYAWDFGDGSTGTGATPQHTYPGTGDYTVALTVTDDRAGTSTVTHVVHVAANVAPVAAFSSSCTNLACTFDGSTSADSDGTVASYAWAFGDGGTSTAVKPSHTFTSGSHDVTLTVTDNDGATNATTQTVVVSPANNPPTAGFTADPTGLSVAFTSTSTDADGSIASYAWDFGDGGTSTVAGPSHTYTAAGTYTVGLTVTDNQGATGTATRTVTVTVPNQKPTASFTAVTTGLTSAFNAGASTDPDGSVVAYAWNFGDGTTGTGASTSHTYAAGTYTVTLTVTDDDGATDTATRTVSPAPTPNQAPTAAFTSTTSGLTATFDGTGSSDPDGTIVGYAWTFGDSTTGTGATPPHTYGSAGTYTVALTVTDDDGATKTVTRSVTVTAPAGNTPPVAAFSASCTLLACTLDGTASSDPDGSIASYAWAFGDTTSGTGATVSHTYAAAGTYSVVLTVTDNKGATTSLTRAVTVTAPASTLATDAFGRTVAGNTWGTADTGGAWTNTGSKTAASVADGSGRVSVPAGYTAYERLSAVQNLNTDVTHTVWIESLPTGGGAYLGTIVRATSAGDYNAQVKVLATGAVVLSLQRSGTTLGTAVTVPGLTYTAGKKLNVRVQAVGSAPTTLRARVWATGTTEPSTWTVTATDSTAGFQVAGSVGVFPYLSGSATAPVVVRYDDFRVANSN